MKYPLQIPGILVKQGMKQFFLTSIPCENLIDDAKFKVDYWKPDEKADKDQGYQRLPNPNHANKVAGFLHSGDSILPTAIVLNSRSKINFKQHGDCIEIEIDHPLWVVDGQHRIAGLKKELTDPVSQWRTRSLPAIILDDFEREEEAQQFEILNKTQKGIKAGLLQRLQFLGALQGSNEANWQDHAVKITDILNDTVGSTWRGKIKLPNEVTNGKPKPISQEMFVSSLKKLISEPGPLSAYKHIDHPAKAIMNYWNALSKIYPDAFRNPKLYVVQKTTGVYVFNDLAVKIFQYDQVRTEESLLAVLKVVLKAARDEGEEDFWTSKNRAGASLYGNAKARKILADTLKSHVPEPKNVTN